jgi:hypothetical protein
MPLPFKIIALDSGYVTHHGAARSSRLDTDLARAWDLAADSLTRPWQLSDEVAELYFREPGERNAVEFPGEAQVPRAPVEVTHVIAGLAAIEARLALAAVADDDFGTALSRSVAAKFTGQEVASSLDPPFFIFFSSVLAAIESVGYAMAWLPWLAHATQRPSPRSITLPNTVVDFRRRFRSSVLTSKLIELSEAPETREIRDIRNMLSHRVAAFVEKSSAGSGPGTLIALEFLGRDLPLAPELTATPRAWTARAIGDVLAAVPDFVDRHILV